MLHRIVRTWSCRYDTPAALRRPSLIGRRGRAAVESRATSTQVQVARPGRRPFPTAVGRRACKPARPMRRACSGSCDRSSSARCPPPRRPRPRAVDDRHYRGGMFRQPVMTSDSTRLSVGPSLGGAGRPSRSPEVRSVTPGAKTGGRRSRPPELREALLARRLAVRSGLWGRLALWRGWAGRSAVCSGWSGRLAV